MPNEAKTMELFRSFLRDQGHYNDENIVIEEQISDNAKIDKLLKHASKRGSNNGRPDFIIYSKNYPELLIVVEAKALHHSQAEKDVKFYMQNNSIKKSKKGNTLSQQ